MQHEIKSAMAGTVGGLVATAILREAARHAGKLPAQLQPPSPVEDPGEHMVGRFEHLVGRALPGPLHRGAAQGLGFGYGAIGPLAIGLLAPRLGLHRTGRTLAVGAGLGAAVWAAGYLGWLPATGLLPRERQRILPMLSSLATHVGWGMLASLPLLLVEKRARPRWRRAFGL